MSDQTHFSQPHQVIAIDGPAAGGKGTLARALARVLGYAFLDTGALYRLVAWRLLESAGRPDDAEAAAAAAQAVRRDFTPADLDNPALRGDAVAQATSEISVFPAVRDELIDLQRKFSKNPPPGPDGAAPAGAVLDGRDIGTVICPDASVKLYITAAPEIRARRRYKELQSRGIESTYEAVLSDMRARDARDSGRKAAPLRPADDAVLIDTSEMDEEAVLAKALEIIAAKQS